MWLLSPVPQSASDPQVSHKHFLFPELINRVWKGGWKEGGGERSESEDRSVKKTQWMNSRGREREGEREREREMEGGREKILHSNVAFTSSLDQVCAGLFKRKRKKVQTAGSCLQWTLFDHPTSSSSNTWKLWYTHTHTTSSIQSAQSADGKSWVSLECQPVTLRIKVSTKGKVLQSPKLFGQFLKNLNLVTTFEQESATMYLLRPSPRNINAKDKSYSISLNTTQFLSLDPTVVQFSIGPPQLQWLLLPWWCHYYDMAVELSSFCHCWHVFPTAGSASAVLYWSIATQTELIINISRADNNWTNDSSGINKIISISLVVLPKEPDC